MTITNLNRLGTLSGPSGRERFQILFLFISLERLVYINLVPGADVTIKQSVGSANRAAAERITRIVVLLCRSPLHRLVSFSHFFFFFFFTSFTLILPIFTDHQKRLV